MNYYYSEPRKEKSSTGQHWIVDKVEKESKKILQKIPFHGETAAWDFLETITITINGNLVYQGK